MESIMRLTENNNKDNSDMKRIIFVPLCVVLFVFVPILAQDETPTPSPAEPDDVTEAPTATPDTAEPTTCLLYTSPSPRD